MDLNQFTQFFDNPKVSVFNRSKKGGQDMRIGPWYPTYWDLCSFGNSHKGRSYHSMRLAPMLAPNFSDLRLQEHHAVVPLRVIMSDFEDKFNYARNPEGASLPHLTSSHYHMILRAMLKAGVSPIGSLLDFLGFPVYADLFKVMLANISKASFTDALDQNVRDIFRLPQSMEDINTNAIDFTFDYRSTSLTSVVTQSTVYLGKLYPFYMWIYLVSNHIDPYNPSLSPSDAYEWYESISGFSGLDKVIAGSIFTTVESATNAYLQYLFGFFLYEYLDIVDVTDVVYSTIPLRAYWRCHYDWNTNGNFIDRDMMLDEHVFNLETNLLDSATAVLNVSEDSAPQDYDLIRHLLSPANRLWDNDFFTSLLPTSAADNAITIPANSTVLNLASLTAIQKLALKLSYSSRFRDVVWNIFKIRPSDARLQQSSIIKQKTHNIGIGESLQTSQTTTSSVLGSFAGRGYSSGNNDGYHIFCEEPCVVLSFMSFVPRASYADALHPLIHVDDILDFPIPDMDVLGNQPIYADLLSGNIADSNVVLGYGRQYQEWLYQYNTVHGDLMTTLDYWQLVRRFTDTPAINDDFLRIDDHDDLDSIFSVPNAAHAYVDYFYNCHVTRHVHRSVRIQI